MKSGDTTTRGVLRLLNSDVKNMEIEKGGDAGDKEIIEIIKRSVKRQKDSIEQYEKGNRVDLSDKEKEELAILEKYMPEQINDKEIRKIVVNVIKKIGTSNASEFGKIIGAVMKETDGNVDGNLVSRIVKDELK
ncbi:MAG: GatB/YqeY domain-containing protein [Candidatus Pacebacteria bacterium]|nr:GatB/YqeY domain-containing protein [Candidatus Paceibacterota bacterium]